ncbi:MAG TPA: dephospho-CoA kinase [Propionibacteriaceae bacterium]|nr:dephospho-CoA kinase [Propionibacteriaceae bacterium]
MTRTGPRSSGGPSVVVGLTGGIASGKSSVAALLADRGAVVIDADVLAREVVAKGEPLLDRVAQQFGTGVLTPDGSLDRAALGRIVFADEKARKDLEALVHPAVRRRAEELEAAAPDGSVVVHVIPLLVETGQADRFDLVVVVDADETTQLSRIRARDGLDDEQARARIAAQASREARLSVADVVVDNSGSPQDLEAQADVLWQRLSATSEPPAQTSSETVGGTT